MISTEQELTMAHAEVARLKTLLIEVEDFLIHLDDLLDDQLDIIDGDDGEPRPNRAMQLSTTSQDLQRQIEEEIR